MIDILMKYILFPAIRYCFYTFYIFPIMIFSGVITDLQNMIKHNASNHSFASLTFLILLGTFLFFMTRHAIKTFEAERHITILKVERLKKGLEEFKVGFITKITETPSSVDVTVDYDGISKVFTNPMISSYSKIGSDVIVNHETNNPNNAMIYDMDAYSGEKNIKEHGLLSAPNDQERKSTIVIRNSNMDIHIQKEFDKINNIQKSLGIKQASSTSMIKITDISPQFFRGANTYEISGEVSNSDLNGKSLTFRQILTTEQAADVFPGRMLPCQVSGKSHDLQVALII